MQGKIVNSYVLSPLNYTGGKGKLLPQIMPLFPNKIDIFLDLFCGGCNVGINVQADRVVYNDINNAVIGIFKLFRRMSSKTLVKKLDDIVEQYDFSKTSEHNFAYYGGDSMKGVSVYNREKFIKLRQDFNSLNKKNNQYYVMLYALIVFGFNNQIRFNSNGEYNLPVGKRDFNDVIRNKLIRFMEALKKQNCTFLSKDFRKISLDELSCNSFIYIDPPYLISTATYNEGGGWSEDDERDLLRFLDVLISRDIKFGLSNILVHKKKENVILKNWIKKHTDTCTVYHLNYDYSNANYQLRNIKSYTDEIYLTNYVKEK